MSVRFSRREFLRKTSTCAGLLAGSRIFGAPFILAAEAERAKLRTAVIGCGGRGQSFHIPAAMDERLVALVDVDDNNLAKVFKPSKKPSKAKPGTEAALPPGSNRPDPAKVKTYNDYRKMFDEMAKEIDVVFVATPNHHHALPALMAMKLGKHVYVEKPLTHTVFEARQMAEFAKTYKVTTQMGNQGHSGEGYRRLCEYIWAGAIGKVTEVISWCDRKNGGVGPRPEKKPVPAGMHWDEWIGPAPFRDFHDDLHPHEWHGWYDFGNGGLGNLGCHVMDGAHWALKLDHPTSIELEEVGGGSDERYPTGSRIRWDFPARGDMPPLKLYWYDGKKKGVKSAGGGETYDSVDEKAQNFPPMVLELQKKYGIKLETNGTLYVGDKGIMYTGCYGGSPRIIPEEQHKATPLPEKSIPRIKGSHTGDFLRACRGGEPPCSNFEVGSRLTELVILGCLADKAGLGKKIEWDGPNMKCTNIPEINKMLKRENRKGWEV